MLNIGEMMADEDSRYKTILDNLYDGVYFVDRERRILYWNHGAERITGFKAEQILGRRCMDNILNHVTENGTQLCLNGCPLHATIQDGHGRESEVFLHHADGHRVPVSIRTSPMRNADGEIIGAVEIFSDNSSLMTTRRRVNRLEQKILLDPLTGIGNRRLIDIRLQSALSEYRQHGIPFGVLFMDVDHFKQVNDRYGHDIGDRLLIAIANTLYRNLRSEDTVGRWGGEEFVAVLHGVDRDGLMNAAEKLCALVANSNLTIDRGEVRVTLSIGATLLRSGDDIEALIQRVDQNMYRSKQAGRNRASFDLPPSKNP